MNIGQLIKMERQKQNMKQENLARGICSPSHLSKIENGTTIAGYDVQQMLLQRLNISLENAFANSSPEQFTQFNERFKEVINQRDETVANLLCQEVHSFLEENPLYHYKINMLLMETRLMLMTSTDFTDAKKNMLLIVTAQIELSHAQQFHLYIIQGIIAYMENRFTNALHIFTDAHKLTREYRAEDWEMAELHYVLSLSALSDYRYIPSIDHAQEALVYFNAKMLATRSIDCLLILGIAQNHIGNVNDALVTFNNAKEIISNSGISKSIGMIEQNLGTCYSLLKNSERALHHFNQSLSVKVNPNDQIVTIWSIAKEYKKTRDIELAKSWVTKGITLFDQLTEQNINLYIHHFSIYQNLLYDDKKLIPTFESALHYFEDKQDYYLCFVYCNILAERLTDNSQFKLATTFYQKAFDYHLKHQKVQNWEELT